MDVSLDLAGDGELVAVEGDPAQVGQQVGLGGGGGTPLGDLTGQHVQLLTGVTTGEWVTVLIYSQCHHDFDG